MSFLGNVMNFEQFKLGNMWDKVKKNPEQLLLGAGDPFSAGVWSKVTGKKYEPLVDQWGGATPDDYSKAEAKGIDTSDGRTMHGAARVIAGIFAGNAAAGAMGGGAAASGGAAGSAGTTGAAGGATAGAGGAAGSGWQTAGHFAGLANQSGLLAGHQQMQTPPPQFQQGPGFSGLLTQVDQFDPDKRRRDQQLALQGLLGVYRG